MNTLAEPVVTSSELPLGSGEVSEMKEIHFFTDYYQSLFWMGDHRYLNRSPVKNLMDPLLDYDECKTALAEAKSLYESGEKYSRVYVCTQMCFLSTAWLEYGYRIFVHDDTGQFEIKLGSDNERTTREIRIAHNLYRMWENGCFTV